MRTFALPDTALNDVICLACPVCGGELTEQESQTYCVNCDSNFPTNSGVMDLRLPKTNYYDNPLKQQDMQRLNEQFSRLPWCETLGQFLQLTDNAPLWRDNILDEGRFAWKIYLSLRPASRLLDFGCNLGASTKNLAPHFEKTYSLEQTLENAVFTRKRVDKSNANDDITVVACQHIQRIPLQDACTDVVAASHVLELAGRTDTQEFESESAVSRLWQSPRFGRRAARRRQLSLLREMHRVLATDGQLFIRCANRLDYKQLTDNGNNGTQPNKSIVPVMLSKVLSLTGNMLLQRSHLHTLWGYRRLLKQAGFSQVNFIALFEDDDLSEEMCPTSGLSKLWVPPTPGSWKQRLKRNPYLAQNFGIIACKSKVSDQRLEERIADQVSKALGAKSANFHTHHYFVSRKGKLIFRAVCAGQELFVRLPLTEHAAASELNNHSTLAWLQAHKATLSSRFPRPIIDSNILHQVVFAETAVPGRPLVDLLKQKGYPEQCLRIGLEFLLKLNDHPGESAPPLNGSAYKRLVLEPLQNISSLLTSEKLNQLKIFFSKRLENKRIPRGLVHGDYSARNILVEDSCVSGLLDWEDADYQGLPAIDAICLVFSCYSRIGEGFKAGLSLVELARRVDYFSDYLPSLDEYYRRSGVDSECHEGLVILYWVRVISHRVQLGQTIGNTSSNLMVQSTVREILTTK